MHLFELNFYIEWLNFHFHLTTLISFQISSFTVIFISNISPKIHTLLKMDSQPKQIYINGSDHVAGRLASHVAKNLLEGHNVTVLHCENIVYAMPITRARKIYKSYLRKRCVVNPRKGPYHYVEPSKYFERMVKRMTPHKKKRGSDALKRLSCFNSLPDEFIDKQIVVCPKALRKYCQDPIRKHCTFGELLREFGYKHYDIVMKNNVKVEGILKKKQKRMEQEKLRILKLKEKDDFKKEVEAILAKIE
ncbi:ribosomal protein L13 [Edhazardia aedis USNM 41457]|uniref:Ribosomal protein L13 n=1 Tax=Edhazardia aedis (strain USNM 41457) TaxID=1003232 RepID=J9D737_EDHAE|nr:ribosomal protein L13 [Edhazardia aedis USNM 41457]|eukprot:EJW03349.1 ribosomal protein L13 [Edhazardia aedis USNM 41457]